MFRKAQQTVAHQSTLPSGLLGNRDLRALQEIINAEKDFVKSNSRSASDFHKTAESIKAWAANEGEDLQDVLGKLSLLFDHYATSQNRFNAHLSTIRQHFKSIRSREESLAELRARKRSLGTKIEGVERKLHKMSPENKELMKTTSQLKELRLEMENLRTELSAEQAAIGDYKRRTTKEAMSIKCAGLLEFAEKMSVVAEVGKLIIEEIPLQQTQPGLPRAEYHGSARTNELLQEATRSIADVGFAPAGPSGGLHRPDLSYSHQTDDGQYGLDYGDSTRGTGEGHNRYDSSGAWDQSLADDPYAHDRGELEIDGGTDNNPTPIYATHSSSLNRVREQSGGPSAERPQSDIQAGEIHDAATDEWKKTSAEHSARGHPIADQFQSRSPEEQQVGGKGLRMLGNVSNDSLDDAAAPALPHAVASAAESHVPRLPTPPPQDASLGYDVPSGAEGHAQNHGGPAISTPNAIAAAAPGTPNATQDDEFYFQSVGSTRAAQQAVRRPMSPANTGRQFSSSLAAPGGGHEGSGEGRKMTAAAFRKGFARAPSSQHQHFGASTTSLGAGIARPGSAAPSAPDGSFTSGSGHPENGDISGAATAPLAIRKRHSGVSGQLYDQGHFHDAPAPPYDASQQSDVYGGMASGHDNGYGESSAEAHAPPMQPWTNGSRPNSRPSSAAGWRHQGYQ